MGKTMDFAEILRGKVSPEPHDWNYSEPDSTLGGEEYPHLAFLLGKISKSDLNPGRTPPKSRVATYGPIRKPRPRPDHKFNPEQELSYIVISTQAPELARNFSPKELKQVFRKVALKTHPDRGGNAEVFMACKKAFDVLVCLFNELV